MLISQIVKCERAKEDDRPQLCKSTQSEVFSRLARDHTISGNPDKIKRPAARYAGDLVACCLAGCGLGNSQPRQGHAREERCTCCPTARADRYVQIDVGRGARWELRREGGKKPWTAAGAFFKSPQLKAWAEARRPVEQLFGSCLELEVFEFRVR